MIRDDFDVDRATAPDLRSYIYDLEDALRAFEPDDEAERIRRLRDKFTFSGLVPVKVLMFLADGRRRSKEAIHAALYAGKSGDGAHLKMIDVMICKVRAAIHGAPFSIETIWGQGYRLVDPAGELKAFLDHGTDFDVDENAPRRPLPLIGAPAAPAREKRLSAAESLLLKVAELYPVPDGASGAWLWPKRYWRQTVQFSDAAKRCAAAGWLDIIARNKPARRGQWCVRLTAAGLARVTALKNGGVAG